jgi:hypothetical protein
VAAAWEAASKAGPGAKRAQQIAINHAFTQRTPDGTLTTNPNAALFQQSHSYSSNRFKGQASDGVIRAVALAKCGGNVADLEAGILAGDIVRSGRHYFFPSMTIGSREDMDNGWATTSHDDIGHEQAHAFGAALQGMSFSGSGASTSHEEAC